MTAAVELAMAMYNAISSMGDNVNEISEPTSGSVVRVNTPRAKYPEIWVASYINGGRWYPDTDSWLGGSARHDHPEGCDWYTLTRRGAITLLTDVDREAYRAGWNAGVAAAAQAAEELEGECPL